MVPPRHCAHRIGLFQSGLGSSQQNSIVTHEMLCALQEDFMQKSPSVALEFSAELLCRNFGAVVNAAKFFLGAMMPTRL